MNPNTQVSDMLAEAGAHLVRQNGKHEIYKLDNGAVFEKAKTPSDRRAGHNQVKILKALTGKSKRGQVAKVDQRILAAQVPPESEPPPPVQQPEPPQPEPAPPPVDAQPRIVIRLTQAIAILEARQLELMTETDKIDKRIALLRHLQTAPIEPEVLEDILTGLVPARVIKPSASQPPPTIQVTREIVKAAAQAIRTEGETQFTLDDLTGKLTNGVEVNLLERKRIRQSIAAATIALTERGHFQQTAPGLRNKPAIYQIAGVGL